MEDFRGKEKKENMNKERVAECLRQCPRENYRERERERERCVLCVIRGGKEESGR